MHQHTNRLIYETSPYLLQHAHNPVDWRPWGTEALDQAKAANKPVLVSIGYAACHWCHVMERESFENEATAGFMNQHFINIKIDREERPDIDHIYMDAVQAMTGSGGWPLNVFLLPDGKPFYGGTYFPPIRAFNRSSWMEVLQSVSEAWQNKKHELESQAENLTEHIRTASTFSKANNPGEDFFSEKTIEQIAVNLLKNADPKWGGFGNAPKFPQTFSIQFLLQHYYFSKNEEALNQALLSLDKMIDGGIYDQLGGGFARYSTDEKWLAPHFEKMLYDNALLLGVLAEAFQLTGKNLYKQVIEQTMDFLQCEMLDETGGFYSALDADSEGVEGKFYTWSKQEIDDILQEESNLFCEFFDVTEKGSWEHTNILWVTKPLSDFAKSKGLSQEELKQQLEASKSKLLKVRSKRIRPQLDDKILLGWNALMSIACCKVYAATAHEKYKELAEQNLAFMEKAFATGDNGLWHHTYKNGVAKYPAFLDDYAYLISACIHLQEVTANQDYLLKAKSITNLVVEHFSEEEESVYFYYTGQTQEDVILRKREVYDGATPSGNAVMAANLHYLSIVFDESKWRVQAQKMIQGLGNTIVRYPSSFGYWAFLFQQIAGGNPELIITGKDIKTTLQQLMKMYIPGKILLAASEERLVSTLLINKDFSSEALIYFCKDGECRQPVKTVAEIKSLLK